VEGQSFLSLLAFRRDSAVGDFSPPVLPHKVRNRFSQKVRDRLVEVYQGRSVKGFDPAPYIAAQREAMEKKRGMWVQGVEYVSPRDWRSGQGTGLTRDSSRAPRLKVISGEEGLDY
jgi:hypothetical protein